MKYTFTNKQIFSIISLLVLSSIISCKNKIENRTTNEIGYIKDTLSFDPFENVKSDTSQNNSNSVNIFKTGSIFEYNYEYYSKNGKQYFFKQVNKDWEFVDITVQDTSVVKFVTIKVLKKNPMNKHLPENGKQIGLTYTLGNDKNFSSISGVIENQNKVWMHPPRDKLFKILELNPFPYVKTPLEIGNKWEWSLEIGEQWGDKRWKKWKGSIDNTYNYKIVDRKIIETDLGSIDCFIIESTATSSIGKTELKALFNIKYGFVKLNYINIDGSRINLELKKYSQ